MEWLQKLAVSKLATERDLAFGVFASRPTTQSVNELIRFTSFHPINGPNEGLHFEEPIRKAAIAAMASMEWSKLSVGDRGRLSARLTTLAETERSGKNQLAAKETIRNKLR